MPLRLLLLILLSVARPADAQSLFANDQVLEVELAGPLGSLFDDKHNEERVERPFTLKTGDDVHNIMVRIRGKSRVRLCSFPPLRLNFGEDAAGKVVTGPQKLKLVTHCSNSKFAETDVLEEYAAYRIMNVLSDTSYRVRLLHIRYSDTDGRVRGIDKPRWGFLIEPREQLAERMGGSVARISAVARKRLDQEYAALMYVFQYLVGNTDWSLVTATGEEYCCHNVTPVDIPSLLYPIPYDFDMTGLVNARYAVPNPRLREIDKVTQRLYRGYCTDPEILRGAIRQVTERREDIRQVIMDLPEMDLKKKNQKLSFLERFFKDAGKGDRLYERFEDDCLGNYKGSDK